MLYGDGVRCDRVRFSVQSSFIETSMTEAIKQLLRIVVIVLLGLLMLKL